MREGDGGQRCFSCSRGECKGGLMSGWAGDKGGVGGMARLSEPMRGV